MPKNLTKKRKSSEEEALEFVEELTEKLKKAVTAEPMLRENADKLSAMMTGHYDKDSITTKNVKFAVRALIVADIITNEEVKIEDVADAQAIIAMTAETVFGLSKLEALALAHDIGETVFEAYDKDEKNTAVHKTLFALTACIDFFNEATQKI